MAELSDDTALVSIPRVQGDAVIADVRGEIDLHNSPELRGALLEMLSRTNPVAVLVEALQKLRRVGGKLLLTGLQPRVKGLLEIARLDSIFVLATTEADALAK
jgi:anti-sigma B factor antagonist